MMKKFDDFIDKYGVVIFIALAMAIFNILVMGK
jgi:hypothetical protein